MQLICIDQNLLHDTSYQFCFISFYLNSELSPNHTVKIKTINKPKRIFFQAEALFSILSLNNLQFDLIIIKLHILQRHFNITKD